jgi:hypothetical protein
MQNNIMDLSSAWIILFAIALQKYILENTNSFLSLLCVWPSGGAYKDCWGLQEHQSNLNVSNNYKKH